MRCWLCVAMMLLGFVACATPPSQLAGGVFDEIDVRDAQEQDRSGRRVRWGGSIVAVTTGKEETCFEILSRPLDGRARPRQTDETWGRFLACAPGFHDPAVCAPGRELTIIGTLQATTPAKIGEFEYRYPRVAVERMYLWPGREQEGLAERPRWYPFWDPFWGRWPYWPYYYPYYPFYPYAPWHHF